MLLIIFLINTCGHHVYVRHYVEIGYVLCKYMVNIVAISDGWKELQLCLLMKEQRIERRKDIDSGY